MIYNILYKNNQFKYIKRLSKKYISDKNTKSKDLNQNVRYSCPEYKPFLQSSNLFTSGLRIVLIYNLFYVY